MTLIRPVLVFFFYIVTTTVFAEESLETVLQRLKPKQAMAIAYHEKRSMGFFSEDQKSHGILYSTPTETLLKIQKSPYKLMMGIEKDQLYYYSPRDKRRYHTQIKDELPMSASIEVLKALMNGDIETLKQKYSLNFRLMAQTWRIELIQKEYITEDDLQPLNVILQGQISQPANSLIIIEADGDRSNYRFTLKDQGKAVAQTIQKILKVLKDQP